MKIFQEPIFCQSKGIVFQKFWLFKKLKIKMSIITENFAVDSFIGITSDGLHRDHPSAWELKTVIDVFEFLFVAVRRWG